MAHTSVSTTVVYCPQSKLPTHQSANITVHCTQKEKTVTIQLCQFQYPSTNMTGWCIMNWNGCGTKWSRPVWSNTVPFAWRDREKPMKICQVSWCYKDSHQVLPSEPIPSVDLYYINHHHYQNKCLIHMPVYLSMSLPWQLPQCTAGTYTECQQVPSHAQLHLSPQPFI